MLTEMEVGVGQWEATAQCLERLARLDVHVSLDGDRLRVNAPRGALTAPLQRELANRKSEIVAALRRARSSTQLGRDAAPPLAPRLSFAQERLWFLDQLEGSRSTYNVWFALRLRVPLVQAAMQASLEALVRRHPALRTRFVTIDGAPIAEVLDRVPVTLTTIDLQPDAFDDPQAALMEQACSVVRQPFSLAEAPLFRFTLIRLSDTDHALIMTLHHIICDGWSLEILEQELASLYAGFVQGRPAPLADLHITYAQYVANQRAALRGEETERLTRYWRALLAGAPPRLDLPLDHPRPAVASGNGERVPVRLSLAMTASIMAFSRAEGVTPFMVLLSAFGALLGRYAGQEDVVVGCPIAGRTSPDLERVVGLFVNTLPLRIELGGAIGFRELVARVRERALDAYAHQELPFEKLVEALHPQRIPGERPLAQAMFVLQNTPGTRGPESQAGVETLPLENHTSKFDLSLELVELEGRFEGHLEYDSDVFEHATIQRAAEHLSLLLERAIQAPTTPMHDLPIVTVAEQEQLLATWNATATDRPAVASVHQLVQNQVDRTPDAVALVCGTREVTFQELDSEANRLAHFLRRRGIGRGSVVALSLERTVEMLASILAVSKAGAAYVPIEPGDPIERRRSTIADSQAELVLAHIRTGSDLGLEDARVVYLDASEVQAEIANCPSTRLPATTVPHDPLYVIYTSGSTGTPKGVVIAHQAVMNLLHAVRDTPGLDENDVVLAITTLSFDIAVYDLWAPLTCGARIVLAPREAGADAELLARLLDASGATVLQATPSTWRLLMQAGWANRQGLKVISTGESLPADLASQLVARCDDVWNMYGPTETTVWSMFWRVSPPVARVLIGRPLANTQVYVLDSHLQLQPIGVSGELYIAGEGVSDGYLGRPELTAERFVTNPFGGTGTTRMYRTGDVARWRADGQIECLGRNDQQVKLRGFRIELGEVESVLRRHPDVADAAAMVREDTPGDHRLVAYVTTRPGGATHSSVHLRTFLGEYLPRSMVPSVIVNLDQLPHTANGKVARAALPAPDRALEPHPDRVAPRDYVERTLVGIWEELLGRAPIAVRDNFFDLGGHSLLAARLVFRINALLGRNLPVSALIQAPTIEQLGQLVRAENTDALWQPLVELQPGRFGRRPIFLVHGAFGDVLCYAHLARELGADQPCYVLQAIGLDGIREPLDRVEHMAQGYIEQMRLVQPHGPYCLAGYSVGGTIAYEMAQQLQAAGEEIALLGIFDHAPSLGLQSRSPASRVLARRFARHLLINIPHWLSMARQVGLAGWPSALRQRAYIARRTLSKICSSRQPNVVEFVDELLRINGLDYIAEWPLYRRRVLEQQHQAMYKYTPRPYTGPMTLFRARRQPLISPHDPWLGWGELVHGPIDVVEVKGNHHALLHYPQVKTVASHLLSILHRQPLLAGGE